MGANMQANNCSTAMNAMFDNAFKSGDCTPGIIWGPVS